MLNLGKEDSIDLLLNPFTAGVALMPIVNNAVPDKTPHLGLHFFAINNVSSEKTKFISSSLLLISLKYVIIK